MKIRPVTCIHVAAYLFSALVLGASAVSYFYMTKLGVVTDGIETQIISSSGRISIEHHRYTDGYYKVGEVWTSIDDGRRVYYFYDTAEYDHVYQFFGITLLQTASELSNYRPFRVCRLHFAHLLLLPLTWMCGFQLVRLRRRFCVLAVSNQPANRFSNQT